MDGLFDEESFQDEISQNDEEERQLWNEPTEEELIQLTKNQPHAYKQGFLVAEGVKLHVLINVKNTDDVSKVYIRDKGDCGRAFAGDAVVVKLYQRYLKKSPTLEENKKEDQDDDVWGGKRYGCIIGILHRRIYPQQRNFICKINQISGDTGLFQPLREGMPMIRNLDKSKDGKTLRKKGHVTVYKEVGFAVRFVRFEEIDLKNRNVCLYIVKYLKWSPKNVNPLGAVIRVISTNLSNTFKYLRTDFQKYSEDKEEQQNEYELLQQEVENLPGREDREEMEVDSECEDRTDLRVFSVDSEGTEYSDDAFSLEEKGKCIVIGVHIADVSRTVQKGSAIDKHAFKQMQSMTTKNAELLSSFDEKVIHMLPRKISEICSITPRKVVNVMSVYFRVYFDENHYFLMSDNHMNIKKSKVVSTYKFTFKEAERCIIGTQKAQGTNIPVSDLVKLESIVRQLRKNRLGNEYFTVEETNDSLLSREMVEELMIMTNHHVAVHLQKWYKDSFPIRRHPAMDGENFESWKVEYGELVTCCFPLRRTLRVTQPDTVCNCQRQCGCLGYQANGNSTPMQCFIIPLKQLFEQDDSRRIETFRQILCNPSNFPNQLQATAELQSISQNAFYECYHPDESSSHFDLNMSLYTHCTSPMRRYIDLIVHRFVSGMLNKEKMPPYTTSEIINLCSYCNDYVCNEKSFENCATKIQQSFDYRRIFVKMVGIIQEVSDKVMALFLHNPEKSKADTCRTLIGFNRLNVSKKPMKQENDHWKLEWQLRIYDMCDFNNHSHIREFQEIPRDTWLNILDSLKMDDLSALKNIIKNLKETFEENNFEDHVGEEDEASDDCSSDDTDDFEEEYESERDDTDQDSDVTTEYEDGDDTDVDTDTDTEDSVNRDVSSNIIRKHHKKVTFHASKGTVLTTWCVCKEYQEPEVMVLLAGEYNVEKKRYESQHKNENTKVPNGTTVFTKVGEPNMKQTKHIDLCIEHNISPIDCFSNLSLARAHKDIYTNEKEYQRRWEPALTMEAAVTAVDDADRIMLLNVQVTFHYDRSHCTYFGRFELESDFCEKYHVKCVQGDYICARVNKHSAKSFWTGHFIVQSTTTSTPIFVKMLLNHSSTKFPTTFVQRPVTCTIELLQQPVSCRRMKAAISKIGNKKASTLARDIAKGSPPQSIVHTSIQNRDFEVPGLISANQPQINAIRKAVDNSFSVIQGPPGTGKTVTGVRLAYMFARSNQQSAGKPVPGGQCVPRQVLYCGPSNKSVDVVAEYFGNKINSVSYKNGVLCKWPIVLRVYGEMADHLDYPIPGYPVSDKIKRSATIARSNPALKEITLHHLIGQRVNETSRKIAWYRRLFKRYFKNPNTAVTREQIIHYKELVLEASKAEIMKAHIIFCTCTNAAAPKFQNSTHWKQVIIDEAGMCSEPESMIPIVAAKDTERVVLIGDHKQLQPIVKATPALDAGLNISLFERYANRKIKTLQMLNFQYRMHEAIEKFPSAHFYEGALKTQLPFQREPSNLDIWPAGRDHPIAFCHIQGKEKSLPVSTEEGSEESKSNLEEAEIISEYVTKLIITHKIEPKNVVVLSNYRSQCTAIIGGLKNNSATITVPVLTVVKSQGSEWDYVILSCVRSLPREECRGKAPSWWQRQYIGIAADPHQINVAVTRAKKGLIIVGNRHLLACNQTWAALLEHFRRERAEKEATKFLN